MELESRSVIYVKNSEMPDTINIRVDSLRGTYYDEKGIKDYEIAKEMYKTIKNKSEIAREMGLNVAAVHRMLKHGYEPFKTGARYWSDFKKGEEWFNGL